MTPLTRQPFPSGRIPADRISPVARKMLEEIPLPNFGLPGRLYDNTRFPYNRTIDEKWYHFRIDHPMLAASTLSLAASRLG